MLEWFCGEVWVDGGEVLRGEEAEEGVAERGQELVGLGGGVLRTAVRGVGETCQEGCVEGGGRAEGEA